MKTFKLKFRSILAVNVEKPSGSTGYTATFLVHDDSTVLEHSLDLSLKDIVAHRSWLINAVLSLMIVAGFSVMIFGLVYIAFRELAIDAGFKVIFALISTLIFLFLWILFSVRSAIEGIKRNTVENERGRGNWKIVDEKDWEKFYRLLMVSKKKREEQV